MINLTETNTEKIMDRADVAQWSIDKSAELVDRLILELSKKVEERKNGEVRG